MRKFPTIIELNSALLKLIQRKGMPVTLLECPTQSFVRFKAIRQVGPYRRQFTYTRNPYELIEVLNAQPDLTPGYNWSLLGRFF